VSTDAPELPPADMSERLKALCKQMFDAAAGVLPAQMGMTVEMSPGGITTVRFTASLGDFMGKGVAAQVMKFGPSPEATAAEVLATATDRDIARRIRTEKLQELARELGYKLTREPKEKK
jgi:hypothetical protein